MRALLIDITKCIGCGSCVLACREQNRLPNPPEDPLPAKLDANNFTVLKQVEHNGETLHYRRICMHCLDPTCQSVCPVGAFQKTAAGPVLYDESRCIGCRYCLQACPFNVPRYEWTSLQPRVRKCNLCAERVAQGLPNACAEACPAEATVAGEREELLRLARARLAADPENYVPRIYGEHEAGGTSVLFLSPVPFEQLELPAHLMEEPLPLLTFRVLNKIPYFVPVGGALLSAIWWITNRRNEVAAAERPDRPAKPRKEVK
jgi:formate dehydrogenase iron-sulfur subunit